MKVKSKWVSIIIILVIFIIFLLILFIKANESLDNYEQQDLETSYQKYLSKGV
ncbi:hypothetical protein [Staphylococcus nepalensis]|uniref:hypothetical protein n=1 Tax=Staphylococcus nepalensis TaxID=214473 RepID=UPI003EE45BAE